MKPAIRISREPLTLANAFAATVRSTVYLGSAVLVHAEVRPELALVVRMAELGFAESLKRGEQVFIGWEPSDGRLLSE